MNKKLAGGAARAAASFLGLLASWATVGGAATAQQPWDAGDANCDEFAEASRAEQYAADGERLMDLDRAAALDALRCALALNPEDVQSLIYVGQIYYENREFQTSEEIFQHALEVVGDEPSILRARVLNNLGSIAGTMRDPNRSEAYIQAAVEIVEEIGTDAELAIMVFNQGHGALNRNNPPAAREYYLRAASLWGSAGDYGDQANSLGAAGAVAAETGDLASARTDFEAALAAAELADDPQYEMGALNNLMRLASIAGDTPLGCRVSRQTLQALADRGQEAGRTAIVNWMEQAGCAELDDVAP